MGDLAKRKNIRLDNYDYKSNGAYFITICTKERKHLFWKEETDVGANCVRPLEYQLSTAGTIADEEIKGINNIYGSNIRIEKYVIMPNHIHMIIVIDSFSDGRTQFAPTVSRIIKQFKGVITKKIGESIWQRSFYDHIIRNENEYIQIWDYIDTNPIKWADDEYY